MRRWLETQYGALSSDQRLNIQHEHESILKPYLLLSRGYNIFVLFFWTFHTMHWHFLMVFFQYRYLALFPNVFYTQMVFFREDLPVLITSVTMVTIAFYFKHQTLYPCYDSTSLKGISDSWVSAWIFLTSPTACDWLRENLKESCIIHLPQLKKIKNDSSITIMAPIGMWSHSAQHYAHRLKSMLPFSLYINNRRGNNKSTRNETHFSSSYIIALDWHSSLGHFTSTPRSA